MDKVKQILGVLLVLFLLAGLPGISYYYLSQGYNYRKQAILTQGDFGKMPDLTDLATVRGEVPKKYRGAMVVVGWLDATEPATASQYGDMLDSLYQQFQNSPNLYFTTVVRADNPAETAATFAATYNLPDTEMISFIAADEQQFRRLGRDFKLPLSENELPGAQPIVALVDSSLTIVKHYNLNNRDETVGLVNLVSLIIPLVEKPDLILERAKEL